MRKKSECSVKIIFEEIMAEMLVKDIKIQIQAGETANKLSQNLCQATSWSAIVNEKEKYTEVTIKWYTTMIHYRKSKRNALYLYG